MLRKESLKRNLSSWRRSYLGKTNQESSVPVVDSEFQCPFCDKTFECKLLLGFHIICECQKVKCAVCDKSFLSKAEFSEHIKQHNSEKQFGTQLSDGDKEYLNGLRKTIKACFGYIVENQ